MSSGQVVSHPGLHRTLAEAAKVLLDFNASGKESLRILQTYVVAEALIRYHGNQSHAARRLGVHRNTLIRQVHELQLEPLIEELVKKSTPQFTLFPGLFRNFAVRTRHAQDVVLLQKRPQGKSQANSQDINRISAVSH